MPHLEGLTEDRIRSRSKRVKNFLHYGRQPQKRFGHTPGAAGVRARTIYLVQIGYISMQTKEDIRLRMSRMPEYVQVYTGVEPEVRELNRFFSRHGVSFVEPVAANG